MSEQEDKINQNQFYDIITKEELSWQSIIYDLIKTEQLDPWDIDLGILAERYIQVIQELEEEDFFVSSKVLHRPKISCPVLNTIGLSFFPPPGKAPEGN